MAQFFKQIDQLRGWRQTAFILGLAERAYPNFALFSSLAGQVKRRPVRGALDVLWDALPDEQQQPSYSRIIALVEEQLPDPEQFEGYGVYPAADACNLLLDALVSRVKPDKKLALASAQMSLATVTQFVELSDAEGMDEDDLVRHLDRHPLVKQELGFQRELVESLRRAPYPSEEFMQGLRRLSENEGISNIGIALSDAVDNED